ncbi:MAG: phosphotransferase [Porticoccus sp.]
MSDSQHLQDWVEIFLPDSCIWQDNLSILPLNGDAGFRRYFRVNSKPSLIAVSAPPEHENNPAFVSVALWLKQHGLHTPTIFAVDYQQGFLLLEDFGDDLLLPHLSPATVDPFYDAAEDVLLKIQQAPRASDLFPDYSRQCLLDEMKLFPEWFLSQLLGLELQPSDHVLLDETLARLADSAQEQPQVVVHRDFHSRNLMLLADKEVGLIDFQDAVIGPVTYDLVSLLRDCYIRWPSDYVLQRALNYYRRAETVGIAPPASDRQILRWFDLMGLQRHIKVLGIFARLCLRDGKHHYLNDLPLVIRYTLEQLERHPELGEFKDWFESRVLPLLPQQAWFQPWETAGD